ncbi:MAG: hypothetical protein GW778_01945 [Alphaproteobacteria bacterium]|nr:hypothetical protein [Alphaproteobacteria bacterium]
MNSIILQKLALERCRVQISQLYAIINLTRVDNDPSSHLSDTVYALFSAINKDLDVLEALNDS